jgi:parallel beta-helix repeat protein
VDYNKQNNIYVVGSGNSIEENLVTNSTNGIYFRASGNFYANNRTSGNTTDFAGSVPTGGGGGNTKS